MKVKLLKLLTFCLTLAVLIPNVEAVVANSQGDTLVRVGLASSSSYTRNEELIGANLLNCEGYGAGYRFGYYDDNMNFIELGRTDSNVTKITMIKTQNTWFHGSDRSSYSNTDNGGTVVGCYHLQLPGDYADYTQASEIASSCGGFVAYINGVYHVRVGAHVDRAGAEAQQSDFPESSIVGTSIYGINMIKSGTAEIIFQYDMGEGTRLAVLPDVTDSLDVRTWFWKLKYRGGFTYQRFEGGNLTVVNVVGLDDYVKGVTPYEMGRNWPLEALKTQAVCARTYVMKANSSHNTLGFDVCTSDHCQVYYGVGSTSTAWGPTEVSDRAVDETSGQVLWYGDRLARTFYSSSHGGASEDAKNIWGTDTDIEHPYLCGVIDPYEKAADDVNAYSPWSVHYSAKELTKRLNDKGFGIGSEVDRMVLTYSKLGNVIKLEVIWTNGQKNTFRPSDGRNSIRSVFGVKSIRFTINGATVIQSDPCENNYLINGIENVSAEKELYVLTGSGIIQKAETDLHAISGKGDIKPLIEKNDLPTGTNEGGGEVIVSGNSYVFDGAGWGHQVGMSQFGAYAMSQNGFTYDQICEFYFPGTFVGPIS